MKGKGNKMPNFKIFNNEEEITAWEEEQDSKWKSGTYVPYTRVWNMGSVFPVIIDLESRLTIDNPNGRDTDYYCAMAIPDLEEFLKKGN